MAGRPAAGARARRAALWAAVAWGLAGCGAAPPALRGGPAGPSVALAGAAGEPLVAVEALAVPASGQVTLRPRAVVLGAAASAAVEAGARSGARPRLQVVLRAVRPDGGVSQWLLTGADGVPLPDAAPGEPAVLDLGEVRVGPLWLGDIAALELVVARLPGRVAPGPGWRGGAALSRAPDPGSPEGARAAAEAIARAGGALVLAVRLPLAPAPVGRAGEGAEAGPPAATRARLVILAPPEPGGGLLRVGEGWRLEGPDGAPWPGADALVVDLELEVVRL